MAENNQKPKEFDCFSCPYLKDVGRAYYCMFFKMLDCPKGHGVPSIWEYYRTGRLPKETREEAARRGLVVIRPPFPDPIPLENKRETDKVALTRLYHREIYEWHYEQGWSFKDIADYLGCSKGYISSYISNCNTHWGWSYEDVTYGQKEKN